MIQILPLNKFRRLKEFSKYFRIDSNTVIAYDNKIYSNKELYPDVLTHEKVHLDQQEKYGLSNFTHKYLNDKKFRLEAEVQAFEAQLNSIKDEGLREAVLKDSILALTSGLYGRVSTKEAEKLLGVMTEKKLDVNSLLSNIG